MIAHEHIYVEEAERVGKVTEYYYRICSMAMAIKEAVGKDFSKAASLEKVRTVDKILNFGNEIHGTRPGLSFWDTKLTSKLEQFPDPARGTIPSSLRPAKIKCATEREFIYNLKLTMSDGTESLLGRNKEPKASFNISPNIKIAKLRSGFYDSPVYPGLKYLTQFELFDQNGGLIWKCGK